MIYFTKFMRPAGATCTEIAPKRILLIRLIIPVRMTRRFNDPLHIPDKFFNFSEQLFDAGKFLLSLRQKKGQPDYPAGLFSIFSYRLPM
ncbi:hypothetical protein [Pantoea agglomerans]|uniref:hypothetical protein n=1 Tax=Enterobacter agglomerans TaxID=549 RepID=UPI0010C17DB3|nr:hypothetical protein [Pantoea agglomerans]TKK21751.1 hypothetical protein PagCFBP13516_05060 [Pantoea agglomerans]